MKSFRKCNWSHIWLQLFSQAFLFKKSKRFALSGVNRERRSQVRCPDAENILSDGTLVADIHRYLYASCAIFGYLYLFRCHQFNGSSLRAISRSFSYILYLESGSVPFMVGDEFNIMSKKSARFVFDLTRWIKVSSVGIDACEINSSCRCKWDNSFESTVFNYFNDLTASG